MLQQLFDKSDRTTELTTYLQVARVYKGTSSENNWTKLKGSNGSRGGESIVVKDREGPDGVFKIVSLI